MGRIKPMAEKAEAERKLPVAPEVLGLALVPAAPAAPVYLVQAVPPAMTSEAAPVVAVGMAAAAPAQEMLPSVAAAAAPAGYSRQTRTAYGWPEIQQTPLNTRFRTNIT
jgi:hypothetical protein